MKDIKFNYENRNNNSYLIYEVERPEEIDRLEQNMLSSNKIDGLLEFIYSNIDDKHYFKYDITSKITLKMYLDKCNDEEKIIKIFINIFNLLVEIEDFMILKEHILFHDDYAFIDISSLKVYFVCLPTVEMPIENGMELNSLKQFINKLSSKLVTERFENRPLISLLKEFLSKEEFSNIEEVKNILKNMLQEKEDKIALSAAKTAKEENEGELKEAEFKGADKQQERNIKKINQNDFDFLVPGHEKKTDSIIERKEAPQKVSIKNIFKISPFGNKKSQNFNKAEKKLKGIDKIKAKEDINIRNRDDEELMRENKKISNCDEEINFNKTVIIKNTEDREKTVLLNAFNSGLYPSTPYLIRKKNNEKVNITSNLFRIGKEIDYVDYAILDNSTISRAHADIIKINNEYFIQDNNSKNHSYVNEIMMSDGQAVKLEHNSEIRLSDELFTFKLY